MDLFGEVVSPGVASHPDVAELDDGPEATPLQLVDEVVEFVGVLDEPRTLTLDAQLHFDDDFVPVEQINFDVLCHVLQSTPHIHYF